MADERRSNYELHAERSGGARRLLDPVTTGLHNAAVWLAGGLVASGVAHAAGLSSSTLTAGAIISSTVSAGYMSYWTANVANRRYGEQIAERGRPAGGTGRAHGADRHDGRRTATDDRRPQRGDCR